MSPTEQTLAELHARAAELDVPRYRMLRREELVAEISKRQSAGDGEEEATSGRRRRGRRRRGARPESQSAQAAQESRRAGAPAEPEGQAASGDGDDRDSEAEAEEAPADDAPTEQVSGILDLMPQRFGFLRLQGLEAAEGDVYISASQIRRCELRAGDLVDGPAREPRRGERHRALVKVEERQRCRTGGGPR